MSLIDTIKQSNLNYQGGTPQSMLIVPDTLNDTSTILGIPAFSTYQRAFLRKLKPTKLAANFYPKHYLDNPPK